MKKQLILCVTACAMLSACATSKAAKAALAGAQRDIQNAESSLAAARNAGAEVYSIVNMSSARTELRTAMSELGKARYDKASFHAGSSLDFSRNAISETETVKKREADLRHAEEARQKAVIEEQAKAKAAAAPKKSKSAASGKSAVRSTNAKPAVKPKAAPQEPAAPQKEEPKKKSWFPW